MKPTSIQVGTLLLTAVCVLSAPLLMAEQSTGWRTDGTGCYPQADPPIAWSLEKNVVWSAPMPSWSNATPVIVGSRIFITSEPSTLLCVNLDDGKILWQKTNSTQDLSPSEATKAKEDTAKAGEITKLLRPIQKELKDLKAQKPGDDAELKKKVDSLTKQVSEMNATLAALKYRTALTHGSNGYAASTPVSDGRNVFAVFGSGIVACYDIEGNRQWISMLEIPVHEQGWGHSASPVLAGDKLLVHIIDFVALNIKNGEVLWRTPSVPHWGTSVLTQIGAVDVVITPGGDIVRISDGKKLAKQMSNLDFCAPIVHDGIVYFIEPGGKALKLPATAEETVVPAVLWTTKPAKDRYYASPIFTDGLLYAITRANVFSVIDAGTGGVVYEKKLELGGGTVYPSITLAGKNIFVSSDNGTTLVLEPGREYKEVGKNTLEGFRSTPVFLGKRMYIRGLKKLYCIGS